MKIKAPDALLAAEVSRRGLMKTTAIGGLALASNALTLPFTRLSHAADTPAPASEKVVWSACTVNCGSRCPLRMHVVDGAIKYVETDNTGDDNYDGLHQVRACLRGRSMRRRVYNPDRLKYPMKRVGKRGEGKFEQISWEEALDTIASNMQRLIKEYGNESIYLNYGTGTLGGTLTRLAAGENADCPSDELLRRLSQPLWRLFISADCCRSELHLRRLGGRQQPIGY